MVESLLQQRLVNTGGASSGRKEDFEVGFIEWQNLGGVALYGKHANERPRVASHTDFIPHVDRDDVFGHGGIQRCRPAVAFSMAAISGAGSCFKPAS